MKLILVPSNPNHGPRVAISVPQDGGDIDTFLGTVVAPALVAFGWSPQSVQDAMHRVEVPGAEDEKPELESDDLTEWSTLTDAPAPPEGFTIVGYNIDCPGPHDTLWDDEDLVWWNCAVWIPTRFASGGDVWYAARNGSETLAKLQAHLAAR